MADEIKTGGIRQMLPRPPRDARPTFLRPLRPVSRSPL